MQQAVVRSQFVTAVAWVFIVMSGFGLLIALAQNVMMQVLFNAPEMQAAVAQVPKSPTAPPFAGLVLGAIRYVFVFGLLMTAGMLAASIGLLCRNNIARVAFISFLVLGIVWNVLGLGAQALFFSHLPVQDYASDGGLDMQAIFRTMFALGAVLTLVIAGVFAWIIKRLTSPAIRAEFH